MTLSYEELVELNKDALEWLKQERPIVHRTLLRWFRGEEHWNQLLQGYEDTEKWLDEGRACFSSLILISQGEVKNAQTDNRNKKIVVNNLNFSNFIFPVCADFKGTEFYGEAVFNDSNFLGDANFSNAIFHAGANFLGAEFSNNNGKADFHDVAFSGYAAFSGAIFSGDADFHDATFSKEACFENAVFSADANFHEVIFSGNADFRVKIFCGDADFRFSIFEKPVDFSGAQFKKESDFSAMRSEKTFNVRETRFHIVPNFMDATFKILPVLDHIEIDNQLLSKKKVLGFWFNSFPDCSKRLSRDMSRRFRILGRRAHETRDWLHEMKFFAQEIRTRRFGLDFPLGEWRGLRKGLAWLARKWRLKPLRRTALRLARRIKANPYCGPRVGRFWFGWIYEVLSNFGRSFARPLGWWAGLMAVFAGLYALLATGREWNWLDPVYLSVRHGLVVGGLVRTGHMQDVIEHMFGKLGSGLALLMMLQTVLSAFFLFLFFLAVRNHFRIR